MFPKLVLSLGLLLAAGAFIAQPASAKIKVDAALMKTLDPDNDGTVDMNEAKAAAATEFKRLDKDKRRHARRQGAEGPARQVSD